MVDIEFEWDTAKAVSNQTKHGVSFEYARGVFQDPFALELFDDREAYVEERYIMIGMARGRVLTVVYTERDGRFRIISARNAEPNERKFYHENYE